MQLTFGACTFVLKADVVESAVPKYFGLLLPLYNFFEIAAPSRTLRSSSRDPDRLPSLPGRPTSIAGTQTRAPTCDNCGRPAPLRPSFVITVENATPQDGQGSAPTCLSPLPGSGFVSFSERTSRASNRGPDYLAYAGRDFTCLRTGDARADNAWALQKRATSSAVLDRSDQKATDRQLLRP